MSPIAPPDSLQRNWRSWSLLALFFTVGAICLYFLERKPNQGPKGGAAKNDTIAVAPSPATLNAESAFQKIQHRPDVDQNRPENDSKPVIVAGPISYHFDAIELKSLRGDAWISARGTFDPIDPSTDEWVLDSGKKATGWLNNWKTFRSGFYKGVFEEMGEPRHSDSSTLYPFIANLTAAPPAAMISSIQWFAADGESQPPTQVGQARSPFGKDEIYPSAIHLPMSFLGNRVTVSPKCMEFLLLPTVPFAPDPQFVEGFGARVYCRSDLSALTPLGQMSFLYWDGR